MYNPLTFLDYQQWVEQFNPVKVDDEPKLYTNSHEYQVVQMVPHNFVWTLTEENGQLVINNGNLRTRRVGNYITAYPWDKNFDYKVNWETKT